MKLGHLFLFTCVVTSLWAPAQETPRPNRVAWFAILPEPLPEGQTELTLEATSQFLRLDYERSGDGRTRTRLDGEEWQLTSDLAKAFGPLRLNVRLRAVHRSGGFLDQLFANWHTAFSMPSGGRELVPNHRLAYHLERDGVVIADLQRPGFHLLDTDLALLLPWGDATSGGRVGVSLQAPTGKREDFSGSGGWDPLVGAAAWKRLGMFRVHGQLEHLWVGLPEGNPYHRVMEKRSLHRAWAGLGYQGQGAGFWRGLGLDISLAYAQSPYRTGISRLDTAGWQQHWTVTHRALPRWRFGFSEEGGSFNAPDITGYLSCRF